MEVNIWSRQTFSFIILNFLKTVSKKCYLVHSYWSHFLKTVTMSDRHLLKISNLSTILQRRMWIKTQDEDNNKGTRWRQNNKDTWWRKNNKDIRWIENNKDTRSRQNNKDTRWHRSSVFILNSCSDLVLLMMTLNNHLPIFGTFAYLTIVGDYCSQGILKLQTLKNLGFSWP